MAVKRVTNGANLRFSTTLSAFVFTEAAFSETMVAVLFAGLEVFG